MKELTTYLNFDGNCRQAMTFYARCLGVDLEIMPFSQAPGDFPKEARDRVMHARLPKGPRPLLMASDTMPGTRFHLGNNFNVCINCESREEIDRLFAALGEKGKVTMALHDAFWGARFGILVDQFGVSWMFNYETPKG